MFFTKCWDDPEECMSAFSHHITSKEIKIKEIRKGLKQLGCPEAMANEVRSSLEDAIFDTPHDLVVGIVESGRRYRVQISLLKIVKQRMSLDQLIYPSMEKTFDGHNCSLKEFMDAIDSLGLGFNAKQKQILARPFLKDDIVNYKSFLAVVKPSNDFSSPTTVESTVFTALDDLRDRILQAKSQGISTRESFMHFDIKRSGVVSTNDFLNGLHSIGIRTDSLCVKDMIKMFPGENEHAINYTEFLRFLDQDYSPPILDNALPYHNVVENGPFIAGMKNINSAVNIGDAIEYDTKGTFVRHSYTAAGYVRQVVNIQNAGKKETHETVPHHKKGRRSFYTGILQGSKPPNDKKTDMNTIAKYLGYPAEICNDYPRISAQKVNTILVRNFRKKRTPESSKKNIAYEEKQFRTPTLSQQVAVLQKIMDGIVVKDPFTASITEDFKTVVEYQRKICSFYESSCSSTMKELANQGKCFGVQILEKLKLAKYLNECLMFGDGHKLTEESLKLIGSLPQRKTKVLRFNSPLFDILEIRDLLNNSQRIGVQQAAVIISEQFYFDEGPFLVFNSLFKNNNNSKEVADYLLAGSGGTEDGSISWKEILDAFKVNETEDDFRNWVIEIEYGFTPCELIALKSIFSRASNHSRFADPKFLVKSIQVDGYIGEFIVDVESLIETLSLYEDVAWEEFLLIIRRYVVDIPLDVLKCIALEIQVSSSNVRDEIKLTEMVNNAHSTRLQLCGGDEWHPSMITMHRILGKHRQKQAANQYEKSRNRRDSIIDRYLISRVGKSTVESIVSQMLQNEYKTKAKVCKEQAQVTARDMIRKKKMSELKLDHSIAGELHKSSLALLEKVRDICEMAYGYKTPETAISYFDLYSFHHANNKHKEAEENLENVLDIFRGMNATRAIHGVASRLAGLQKKQKSFEPAALNYELAATTTLTMSNKSRGLLWREAKICLEHSKNATSQQIINILSHTIDLLDPITEFDMLVEDLTEQATLLYKVGGVKEAKESLQRARQLLLQSSLTPNRRKQMCKINKSLLFRENIDQDDLS